MQAYGASFAKVYNLRWGGFARQVAPKLREAYESLSGSALNKRVLDVCCGAGHMALHFLEHGYKVSCLDLSEYMLKFARENTQLYQLNDQVDYVQADASSFELGEKYGLATSTFDALNHLDDLEALMGCFRSVFQVLEYEGYFIFDLNTRSGLSRWNNIAIEDSDELMVVNRGVYDQEGGRAINLISGFIRLPNGLYERFHETVYNTVFDLKAVEEGLLEAGYGPVYPARFQNLMERTQEPEKESRIFFVAQKGEK
jgi:SAM-dependent methyltransferase